MTGLDFLKMVVEKTAIIAGAEWGVAWGFSVALQMPAPWRHVCGILSGLAFWIFMRWLIS